jgi:hypothetical protein
LLEAHALQLSKLPRIAALWPVANTDALNIDALGQLLGDLGDYLWKRGVGLDIQSEQAVFAAEPQYHGGALWILGW